METTIYLEKFLRNLLLGEKNELKNRYLHVSGMFDENVGVNVGVSEKNVGVKLNKTQTKIIELIRSNQYCTIEEMARFANVETRTIERNLKTLKEKNVVERIGADKNGHWIVKI